jgi:hypothetical protein
MPIKVFIGSSTEGKDYARAIGDVIVGLGGYEILPWWSAVFPVGETFIESLISAADRVDAAVLVATPDDLRVMRQREDFVIRDNVLYEYGLFSGKFGRFRTALAVVGNTVCPTDLRGVTCISLPVKEDGYDWPGYRANFVDQQVREWLQRQFGMQDVARAVADLKPQVYRCLDSQAETNKKKIFSGFASKSPVADYLVLRGRDVLSEKGEIADLYEHGDPHLRVRLLMVDFDLLTEETFKAVKASMDLQWDDLSTEKQKAKERLGFAENLSKNMTFECKLLPANMVPAVKLRLYDRCGFFSFYYRGIGGKRPAGERAVFCVHVPEGERSPLLDTLRQMYDHLWGKGRDL